MMANTISFAGKNIAFGLHGELKYRNTVAACIC